METQTSTTQSAEVIASELDLMKQLKLQTTEQHKEIETKLHFFSPEFTLEDYLQLLKKFYTYYAPLESEIRNFLNQQPIAFDYSTRYKSHLLLQDLNFLNPYADYNKTLEPYNKIAPVQSLGDLLGRLYVIEGATLGGQIIQRQLKKKFPQIEQGGVSFYVGYGPLTGPHWVAFQSFVNSVKLSEAEQQQAIVSAQNTFQTLSDWLTE